MALAAGLVLVAACGSRASDAQLRAGAAANGVQAGSAAGGSAGATSGGSTDGATASTVAGGGGAGGQSATPTTASPGDNGGATDVGVTGNQITIGNVATLSGPVPGLFAGAAYGTQAFVAYQNSLGGVFGRKLKLDIRDDQLDTGQNRSQTVDLISKAFALVGGFSTYDDGAVSEINKAGIPVLQVAITTGLAQSPMNFSVSPTARGSMSGPWNALKSEFPQSIGAAAGIYVDVPAGKESWLNYKAAASSVGFNWTYERGIQATETDFTADVVRMRSAGVKVVFSAINPASTARILSAMNQQGFKPDLVVAVSGYDPSMIKLGGANAENLVNITTQAMYLGEDAAAIPEIRLFREWVQKVKPGYTPDLFAVYGWEEARLFVQALQAAGPKPTRANVAAALKKIDKFDGNGMLPEVGPASKRPPTCFLLARVQGGKWERYLSPPAPKFRCDNSTFVVRN